MKPATYLPALLFLFLMPGLALASAAGAVDHPWLLGLSVAFSTRCAHG